jgi:hypothetical protein
MSAASHITDCGLPGIKEIPYGVHMCHFYEGPADLAAALVPYFMAGLRNNARCHLITAEPLGEAAAKAALQAAGIDVEAAQRKGSLTIRDHAQWYGNGHPLTPYEIVERWFAEEARALADGYDAQRITGNTSFLTSATVPAFMEYERLLAESLQGHRIVTLCSYPLSRSAPADVLDVVRNHDCTLDHPDRGWQILTAPAYPGAFAPR